MSRNKPLPKAEHALIIGGTGGIGLELAQRMTGEGRNVSVVGRRPRENDSSAPLKYFQADMAQADQTRRVLDQMIQERGTVDRLVFFQRYRGPADDAWAGELATSLTGTQNVIEHLVAVKGLTMPGAAIVVIGSVAVHYIAEEQPLSYHVGKAGLLEMARYYGLTLGPYGIRVNGVSFGVILKERSRDFFMNNPKLMNLFETITPLKRMGTSGDVMDAVEFLLSDRAAFITGQELIVDGGISLRGHESLARSLASLDEVPIVQGERK